MKHSRALAFIGFLLLSGGALPVLFLYNPESAGFYPPCLFRAWTGLLCPGCGTTRALHQLLHGDVLAAFRLNPLMVLSLPFVAYSFSAQGVETLTGKSLPTTWIRPRWIWLLLGTIVLYWVLRNTPFFPAWFVR